MTLTRTTLLVSVGITTAILLGALVFHTYTAIAGDDLIHTTSCHTITNLNEAPEKYAPPISFFAALNPLLVRVECQGNGLAEAEVGTGDHTQYIYKYGYVRTEGSSWRKVRLMGHLPTGVWYKGTASLSLSGLEEGDTGEVLVYMCERVKNSWKCGCKDSVCRTHTWQQQTFTYTEKTAVGSQKGDGVVDVHTPSEDMMLSGSTFRLAGSGYEKGVAYDVLWNGRLAQTVVFSGGEDLVLTAPYLDPGKYHITLKEEDVESENYAVVWILENIGTPPVISSISPETGGHGDTYTITGEGFSDEYNDVITTYGVLEGLVSKDGKSISFEYMPFGEPVQFMDERGRWRGINLPVHVLVVNKYGASDPVMFFLES